MTTNEVKRLNTADTVINRNLDIKQDCRQIIDTLAAQFLTFQRVSLETGEWRPLVLSSYYSDMMKKCKTWDELIPHIEEYIHPDDRKHFRETVCTRNIREKLTDAGYMEIEYRRLIKGEDLAGFHYGWIYAMVIRSLDSRGKPSNFVTMTSQDVTALHREIETRTRAEENNRLLEDALRMGNLLSDSHRYPERRMMALKILGEMQGADMVRIVKVTHRGADDYTMESVETWHKNNLVRSQDYRLAEIDRSGFLPVLKDLINGEIIDTNWAGDPFHYQKYLPKIHATNLKHTILMPIKFRNGNFFGYLFVCNPTRELVNKTVLEMITLYFSLACENELEQQRIERMSYYDAITSVYNSNAYADYLHAAHGRRRPCGCIFIDVNGLHEYNHMQGHIAGDEMLRTIAGVVRTTAKEGKTYRIGGDEFLVIYEDAAAMHVERDARRIRDMVSDSGFSVSVGFAYDPACGNVEALVKLADERMYADKNLFYQQSGLRQRE